MFEYEKLLYDSLLIQDFYNPLKQTFKRKHLWIKKAAGLSGSVKNVKGEWVAESPMGTIKIKFADKNRFGILDHDVTLPSGETFYNPMRVFPNKDRSELIFTLYQRPGMSDKDFKNDEEHIKEDLERLKGLVEKQSV